MSKNELTIDGIEYIKKDSIKSLVINTDGLVYTLVRTYSAGVWAGYPTGKVENGEVTLAMREIFSSGTVRLDKHKLQRRVLLILLSAE